MKGILIDKNKTEAQIVDIKDSLRKFYEILDCNLIEVSVRYINGVKVNIICDEEGLFTNSPIVTAIDENGVSQLVGNLFICSDDGEGNFTSLSDRGIEKVMECIKPLKTNTDKEHAVVTEVKW